MTTTPPRSSTAPDIRFDFNTAVQEAYANFPKLRLNTVFHDSGTGTTYSKTALAKKGAYLPPPEDAHKSGMFRSHDDLQTMFFSPLRPAMLQFLGGSFVFDHELGHLLTPYGVYFLHSEIKNECIADAFAAIRHIQRYGSDAPYLAEQGVFRVLEAIINQQYNHFTLPVIARILADRSTVDFSSLSPLETWQTALEYAEKYTPDKKDFLRIEKEYRHPAEDITARNFIKFLCTTCLTSSDSLVFFAGAAVIVHLAGSESMEENERKFELPVTLGHPSWLEMRDKVQSLAQERGLDHLLRAFRRNTEDISTKTTAPSPGISSALPASALQRSHK